MNSTTYQAFTQPQNRGFAKNPRPQNRALYQRAGYAITMAEKGLSMGARILFQELTRACGRRAFTWIEQGELASRLGVSVRTVQRHERALAAAGFVTLARFSLWARWKRGGSRRVAVPHVIESERLVCPRGVLEEAEALLVGDGVVAQPGQLKERRGVTTPLSCQWRKATSLSTKRNVPAIAKGLFPTLRRLIAGTLTVDGAKGNPEADEATRLWRLECIKNAQAMGYA